MASALRSSITRRAIRSAVSPLVLITALLALPIHALAQAAGPAIRLPDTLVPAPDGYEAVTARYVAARPTDLYISPFIWAGKVMGVHLNAGEPVEVLAKPRGFDWLLVGRNGTAIGYVPLSVLSVAKQ